MGDQGLDALVSQPRHQHPCCFSGVAVALVRRADHPRELGVRWRDDRTPGSCTYEQLEQPLTYALDDIVPGLGSAAAT